MPWVIKHFQSKLDKDLYLIDEFYQEQPLPLPKIRKYPGGLFKCVDCDEILVYKKIPTGDVRCKEHKKIHNREYQRMYKRKYRENKELKLARQHRWIKKHKKHA
jgi:hypothetical protein